MLISEIFLILKSNYVSKSYSHFSNLPSGFLIGKSKFAITFLKVIGFGFFLHIWTLLIMANRLMYGLSILKWYLWISLFNIVLMGNPEILPRFPSQIGFQHLQKADDPYFIWYIWKAKTISITKIGFFHNFIESIFRYTGLIDICKESILLKSNFFTF